MMPICTYDACASDADCASGTLCLCGASYEDRNACSPANCHGDADCPAGKKCEDLPTNATGSITSQGRYCRTASDKCSGNDCGASRTCGYDVDRGRWECVDARYPPPG
jgi:hypothetical protein